MTAIIIRYEPNKDVNFVHLINYLVSYKIMTLDQSISLYKRFKATEDIVLEIPDELVNGFKSELRSLGGTTD